MSAKIFKPSEPEQFKNSWTRSLSSRPGHISKINWSISHCSHILFSKPWLLIHSNCRLSLHGTTNLPPILTQGDFLSTQLEYCQGLWNHTADWISPQHSWQKQSFYTKLIFVTWSTAWLLNLMQAMKIHSPTLERKEKDSGTSKQGLLNSQPKETTLGRKPMKHISKNSKLKSVFSYWRQLKSKCKTIPKI